MRQLSVSGLHKAFGTHPVLTGLDLDVPAGAFTAILGPSGSGKTTLLRLLAGFERADAGTITIGDRVVDGPGGYVPPERRKIGYVPQEGALFPHLTIAGNIGFGLPGRERHGPRIPELLDAVGLSGMGKRYPHQLSGGQQQRVALARALAIRPEVVLLDEPFASLDAHMRASVRADVQRICQTAGTTAILVTHDQDEALSMADRIAVLRDGRIVQYAAPADLYRRPADPALARFVGDANLVDGEVLAALAGTAGPGDGGAGGAGGRTVDTILGRLTLAEDDSAPVPPGPVTVLIRPEQLELSAGTPGSTENGCLSGRVVACEYYGHDAVVRVQPDGAAAGQEVIVRTSGGPQLAAGSPVTVRARGRVIAWSR
ncbi:MAG TPA: ABC transporter ATP-binding protein [Streptosporangiaceae bacterium]|jgi:iron(III) transport system ATP-binding protein|nr:ABC transporter ATP-binding protein [Streptosporangiaceae bacterium]